MSNNSSEWRESLVRDLGEMPVAWPLLIAYRSFMSIKRYDHMPYYFYPQGVKVSSIEDRAINFLDWMCDAHEEPRNPHDKNHSFYDRAVFTYKNFNRYSNPTICNVMFETKAPTHVYDRLNSINTQQTWNFYLVSCGFNLTAFMAMSFFFRYRRLSGPMTFLIAHSVAFVFMQTNSLFYSAIVDRPLLAEAKRMGFGAYCQPVNTRKNRSFNYI